MLGLVVKKWGCFGDEERKVLVLDGEYDLGRRLDWDSFVFRVRKLEKIG